jgi:tetratricopeptide (TPR) repeat protein
MNRELFSEAYNSALRSCSDNDTLAASVQIKQALALDPNDQDANHLQGVILTQGGHFSEAIPYFEKALVRCQKSTYYKNYASALMEVARRTTAVEADEAISKAVNALNKSLELNSDDPQARKNRDALQTLLRR